MVSVGAQTIDPWQGVGAPCLGSQRAGVLAFLCFGAVGCESLGPPQATAGPLRGHDLAWDRSGGTVSGGTVVTYVDVTYD